MTQQKHKYRQTVALKCKTKVSENCTTTSLIEYSIYFSTVEEFSKNLEKAFSESPEAISYKLIGKPTIL